jgi:hypothetical protein
MDGRYNMKAILNGNTLTVEMPLSKGTLSKHKRNLLVFTTHGFQSIEGTDLQISINVIKPK